jgi:hypothetical protein
MRKVTAMRYDLSWEKVQHCARWRCRSLLTGETVGFIQKAKSGAWDAYICTGKPWPEADQLVTRPRGKTRTKAYHLARYDVEFAASK